MMRGDFFITKINRVILVGRDEYKTRTISFTDHLASHELIFYFSGRAVVRFNGKTLLCEKNVIRFLPRGEVREYTVDREERGECIDVFFDTDVPPSEEAFTLKLRDDAAVGNLFKKLFSVWVSRNDGYYFESLSLLYKILAGVQKRNYIPESQYKAIKPVIGHISENFLRDDLSVAALAEKYQISESYLRKLFINKFGVPPVRYIIQLRINYACDLLRSGLYTVSRIAEMCGYGNVYYFSRQFKEYIGVTPTDFMIKYRSSK